MRRSLGEDTDALDGDLPSDAPTEEIEVARCATERIVELEAALVARDEFLNLAAHELKTPITALLLYVDGLLRTLHKRTVPPNEIASRIEKVREQSMRLDRLVSSLLDVSRASATSLPIEPEEVDLTELSLTVIGRYREELDRAQSTLDFRTGGPVFGLWDRARLEQALGNLLSNAIKYAPGAPIRVSVMQDGAFARIEVRDNGPGIDEADRTRVFERFMRLPHQARPGELPAGGASQSRPRYHAGFGLGLWLTKQIISTHGGTISLSSEPGAGCTFTVVLPRRRSSNLPELIG